MRSLALAAMALTAAARAECEFPYYPEFADEFSQYDEVTPLLAKKFALARPHPNASSGAFLCEPLLIREIKGTPIFYAVAYYNGGDEDVAKRWNEIVRGFQTTGKVSASELAEELSFFEGEEVRREFRSMTISAFTFGCGTYKMYNGIPEPLLGYDAAYAKARDELDAENIFFSRLILASYGRRQIFEFENASGKKVAIETGAPCHDGFTARIADLESNATTAQELVRGFYEFIGEKPDLVDKYKVRWGEIDRKVPDERAEKELPTIF